MKPQILFVDDEPRVLDSLRRMLRRQHDRWAMTYCDRPETAWEELLESAYDAVVTDIRMPGLSGLDLLERIRREEQTRDVPVVVLTGLEEEGLVERALDLGAIELMSKPVESRHLIARLDNVLRLKSHQDELKASNAWLEERIEQQSVELAQSRLNAICRLANAAECRDWQTGNHVVRVACYSRAVAQQLGMPGWFLDRILLAAPLHDIGKLGIPDKILLKPGPLSPGERAVMERHCVYGEWILRAEAKVLAPLRMWTGAGDVLRGWEDPLLEMAAAIALSHHEKWDGSGYPRRLCGEQIPLESRIVALSDVFDALLSHRPYKRALCEEETLAIVHASAGSHFDPEVHEAFCRASGEIRDIGRRLSDGIDLLERNEGGAP